MVSEQLVGRGIRDRAVLQAFSDVARHEFVPQEYQSDAYSDRPLPIGEEQTISQPYITALMLEQLRWTPGDKVLEVGTGSGYQAALLAKMGANVLTLERIPPLAQTATEGIERMGIRNVRVRMADGSLGWAEEAPFDGILVSACAPRVPDGLVAQLAEGGRLILPIGDSLSQRLMVIESHQGRTQERVICGCLFVPLVSGEVVG